MRSLLLICLLATCFFSCKKDENPDNPNATSYINVAAGSTWNYQETNNDTGTPATSSYTVTSTSRDTSISSKTYHIYDNSRGSHWYLNNSNGDYYQFDSLPGLLGNGVFDRLYLKTNLSAGQNWDQNVNLTIPNVPLPIPITITNNIAEKGIAYTVNGTNYTNVIHVSTSISSALIPSSSITTSINSYYADGIGLIENSTQIDVDYLGIVQNVNLQTKLLSSNLK
ncbi:MAG: hypothetical protein ABIR81_05845 [Ginsengibacter sp.]